MGYVRFEHAIVVFFGTMIIGCNTYGVREFNAVQHIVVKTLPSDSLVFILFRDDVPTYASFLSDDCPAEPIGHPPGFCFLVFEDSQSVRFELTLTSDSSSFTPILDTILDKGRYYLALSLPSELSFGAHWFRRTIGTSIIKRQIMYINGLPP